MELMRKYWTALLRIGLRNGEGNFLGSPLLPAVLHVTPKRFRPSLALRVVASSPHYFPYGSRHSISQEHARNANVGREVHEKLLRPFTNNKRVLEFGCGPGYIAKAVSTSAREVTGVDVSAGAIACAEILNDGSSVNYMAVDGKSLGGIPSAYFDMIYSIAVLMHIPDSLLPGIFMEMTRVLKPSGRLALHVPIGEPADNFSEMDALRRQICLRYVVRSESYLRKALQDAGFTDIEILPVAHLSSGTIDADIAGHHMVLARKP